MNPKPSLKSRIRNGFLILVLLVLSFAVYSLPRVYRLGGAIRETLYRNYLSIDAAHHMHASLRRLELAERDGRSRDVLGDSSAEFLHWMDIENHDFTEVGEPALANDMEGRARRLFAEVAADPPNKRHDQEFDRLHERIDDLIAMNEAAMFRADSRAAELGKRLSLEFAAALGFLLLCGAALSLAVAQALAQPLNELIERLRGISQRSSHVRLGPQRLAELDAVAREFNQMAEQLEKYEQLNVERLLYEKNKTETIIESLEDGVVLIDPAGIVTHINEIAAVIMGVERKEALGSPFDDLSSNHPHYLRIRDALRSQGRGDRHVEVDLFVRGRDHSYVLKPIALTSTEGPSFGTLLILQDVTYLRDQDRARTNLVATLSHELRTPLTSIALSADLLRRDQPNLTDRQRELVAAVLEECTRMKALADNLLNLARGETASIALKRERINVEQLAADALNRFALQAEEKHIALERRLERVPPIIGDPVKLSWVVSNLIGNALRYTPDGGRIEVRTLPCEGGCRLEVADSGPGVAPDIRAHIFERFTQFGADGDRRGAAGLGLAIVKEIVEAHGGRIFLESKPGEGSRFIVELPA